MGTPPQLLLQIQMPPGTEWRTVKPGVLQPMGSQGVRHDLAAEQQHQDKGWEVWVYTSSSLKFLWMSQQLPVAPSLALHYLEWGKIIPGEIPGSLLWDKTSWQWLGFNQSLASTLSAFLLSTFLGREWFSLYSQSWESRMVSKALLMGIRWFLFCSPSVYSKVSHQNK